MNKNNEFFDLKIYHNSMISRVSLLSVKRFLKTCFFASIAFLVFLFSFVSCKQEKHVQPEPDYLQGIEVKEGGVETVIDGQVFYLDDERYHLDKLVLSFWIFLNPSNLDYSSTRAVDLLDNLEFVYDYDADFWEIVDYSYPYLSVNGYYIGPGRISIKPKNDQVHGETSLRFKATDKRTNDIFEISCKVKFIHHPDGAYFEELLDEMPVGAVSKLNVNIIDSYPELVDNSNIIWSSSDESILTVDQTGKVQAVGAGVATITASLEDQERLKYYEQEYGKDYAEDLYPEFNPSCIITVSNALKFESDSQFTLSVIDDVPTASTEIVTWNGEIDYYDESTFNRHSGKWSEWSGKDKVIQSFENKVSGKYEIYIRGKNNNRISGIRNHFKLNGSDLVYCIGDIRALLNYNDIESSRMDNRCFEYLFYNNDLLASCPDLPIKNLASFCYSNMFSDCTSLITPPALPAITLKDYCYEGMFLRCTSLKKCPALPAKNLEWECYHAMFGGCTSLEELPSLEGAELPSIDGKTPSNWCCKGMFYGCTLIKVSTNSSDEYKYEYKLPDLGNLINQSYYFPYNDMFKNTGGDVVEDDIISSGMTLYTSNKIIYPEE